MVSDKAENRPNIEEILKSKWMKEIMQLNEKQLSELDNEIKEEFEIREDKVEEKLKQNIEIKEKKVVL